MDDTKPPAHEERVRRAFEALDRKLGDRLDASSKEHVARVREAAEARDGDALRKRLNELSKRHGWLYRELASHPEIANLLDELALLGL
jgi:Tfp pilus assembly protein PilO